MAALMFLSRIAFKPDMVPSMLKAIVHVSLVFSPRKAFLPGLLADHDTDTVRLAAFPILATLVLTAGASFFKRFKGMLADNV
jgi:ABC-type polysaccharide/polyol phosphate export permease